MLIIGETRWIDVFRTVLEKSTRSIELNTSFALAAYSPTGASLGFLLY